MIRYVVKRLLTIIPTLLLVATLFVMDNSGSMNAIMEHPSFSPATFTYTCDIMPTTGSTTDTTSADTDTSTDTDTGTDTGTEVMGRSVSQMVNSGTVATSPSFRMVFTMGQPTQNQGSMSHRAFACRVG